MKKQRFFKILFWVVFNLLNYSLLGQPNKIEFIGALETKEHQVITYKLSLSVYSNGDVTGTTITDFYGKNSTESKIVGKLNKANNLLSFREISNIRTKSKAEASDFCYIHVSNLLLETKNDKAVINGKFKGYFPNGNVCAEGKIFLVSATILEKLNINEEFIAVLNDTIGSKEIFDDKTITANSIKNYINPSKQLANDELLAVKWNSKTIRIDVWDSYQEDHDQINIYMNEKLVHKAVELKGRKQSFEFTFETEKCVIKIEAINEGTSPPNTVNANLIDDGIIQPFITKLKKGQSASIEISRNAK